MLYFAQITTFDIPLKVNIFDICTEDQNERSSGMSIALCSETNNKNKDRSAMTRFDAIDHGHKIKNHLAAKILNKMRHTRNLKFYLFYLWSAQIYSLR